MEISLNQLSGLHCNTKYDLIFSDMKNNVSNNFNTLITEDSFLFFFLQILERQKKLPRNKNLKEKQEESDAEKGGLFDD